MLFVSLPITSLRIQQDKRFLLRDEMLGERDQKIIRSIAILIDFPSLLPPTSNVSLRALP